MRTFLIVLCLLAVACGRPAPGFGGDECALSVDHPWVVDSRRLPTDEFQLVGDAVCFEPEGAPRPDTCARQVFMVCGEGGGMTYCPSPFDHAVARFDPVVGHERLFCVS